ncbi:MAG: porin family protein [Chitinophagaceae bacterium]
MKKHLLYFLMMGLFLLMVSVVQAQSDSAVSIPQRTKSGRLKYPLVVRPEEISAGMFFGYNNSNLAKATVKHRSAFHVGGYFTFRLTPHWEFQPEIQFSLQGAIVKNRIGEIRELYTSNVLLPLTFIYTPKKYKGPYFQFGFQPVTVTYFVYGNQNNFRIRNKFWVSDVEALLGVGWAINPDWGFYVRYNHGFKQLNRSDAIAGVPVRNRVYQAGIFFNIDRW